MSYYNSHNNVVYFIMSTKQLQRKSTGEKLFPIKTPFILYQGSERIPLPAGCRTSPQESD
jgi:hypothetical protein